jgi:hypothetical protein
MNKNKTPFDTLSENAATYSREGMEIATKSWEAWAKGTEEIMKTTMDMLQEATKKRADFMQETMRCKTMTEWANTTNKAAQTSYDDFVSGTTKLTEVTVKTLTDASEPISEQISKAIQKASSSMAA